MAQVEELKASRSSSSRILNREGLSVIKNHVLSRRELAPIEWSNFIVVNLPEDVIAKFSAEGFEFVKRVEIE